MKLYVDARLPWGSGIGRYVASIVPALAAARPDWQVTVGVAAGEDGPAAASLLALANVTLLSVPIRPLSLAEQHSLAVAVGPADLAWLTNYWVPMRWPGRWVATVHDLLHLNPALFPASAGKRAASWLMFQRLARGAAGLLFVSRFTRREFERRCGTPRRAAVVHHGVDHFAVPAAPGLEQRIALTVGAPKRHKNLDMLIEAWAAARLPSGWRLVVVTPGDPLRSKVALGSRESGNQVLFKSALSDEELGALYAEAALFLFPTLYEGFGFPLLEAALAGCRLIASTAPAVVEISGGMQVLHADPYDREGWIRLIEEETTRFERGEAFAGADRNRLCAQSYRWSDAAACTAEFLECCLRD